ncbi:MAG: AAA family ATPase [Candidatus Humimicrobiia bacterium]
MFTDEAQQLLDNAKTYAMMQKKDELTLEILLTAIKQNIEARVLLARFVGLSIDKLSGQDIELQPDVTLYMAKISTSKEVQAVIKQARELAMKVPDRLHPGLIGLRHLVCALAISRSFCNLLNVTPVSEKEAIEYLSTLYESDEDVQELGDLTEHMRIMRTELLGKVFGQDHAVHAFVEGLFNAEVIAHADTTRKSPSAIFVFAGPPGVGKSYLAKLGASYFKHPFKQFNMSSYSDHQSHIQLVGFQPSFQAAKPGILTEFVFKNPDAVLLFDEIEKAHPNVIQLFLQILDSGEIEDQFKAEKVAFRDTKIIFTTNAGSSLYDNPNETGINAANATFHRRTILDALRTERRPDGRPFFPPAICSRLATGYPVLFNHLGVNELQRIACTEINRVKGLIEQQYYKSITYDDELPLAMVLREGANTDARTVSSQSGIFVKTELFKFFRLYKKRRLDQVLDSVDTIHFCLDPTEMENKDIASIFKSPEKSKILLVAQDELSELFKKHVSGVEWLTANTTKDAIQIIASNEIDMILLDIWLDRDINTMTEILSGTIRQFDYVPAAARALAEGQELLRAVHERLPTLPIYLISIAEEDDKVGTVDEELFLACVKSGGARGILTTSFTSDKIEGWQERCDQFIKTLQKTVLHIYREKKARNLGQERKVLAFDTAPSVDQYNRQVAIRLRNLHLSRAVAAEDSTEVLEDVERPTVRFSDVFGANAAKEALQFVVDWLRNPRRYAALGVRPPKGILLTGPPGTGKTMLARALAGESDVAFLVASGTDFVTIWQGSGPQNIRNLFNRARRYAPSIAFIDELDAIGKTRMGGGGAGRAEESTLNALLTEMDGFGNPTMRSVILLAATNLAEHLDKALLRRFDRIIEVPPPDREARSGYLKHQLLNRKSSKISKKVVDSIAVRSAGMTIADLRHIVNEASVMAAQKASPLTDKILEEAFEKIRMGEAKKTPDKETLKRISHHEAGHALIGWLTGNIPMQVTIIGRGSAGGYMEKEIEEEKIIYTQNELEDMICLSMGGRAAELIYYGNEDGLSTGVASDLKNATIWAKRMIQEFGMSDEIGQIFYDSRYLQDGPLAAKLSNAAEHIIRSQLDRAIKMLKENRKKLDKLSTQLLKKNRIMRSDLEKILSAKGK